jgi:CheY-like chemotaxis protein
MIELASVPGGPAGLLLSRDLLFTSKVTSEARAQGVRVMVAGSADLAAEMIDQWQPRALFLDLTAGDLVSSAALLGYRRASGPDVPFIAFGPHVDKAALASAKDAGCDLVLPRSKFSAELVDLIRRFLLTG